MIEPDHYSKSVHLRTQEQALTCFHYIHQNPIRAGMVDEMGDWPYSSFSDYAEKRKGTLVKKAIAFKLLDIQKDSFISESKQALNTV